jgi:hypothetical protein
VSRVNRLQDPFGLDTASTAIDSTACLPTASTSPVSASDFPDCVVVSSVFCLSACLSVYLPVPFRFVCIRHASCFFSCFESGRIGASSLCVYLVPRCRVANQRAAEHERERERSQARLHTHGRRQRRAKGRLGEWEMTSRLHNDSHHQVETAQGAQADRGAAANAAQPEHLAIGRPAVSCRRSRHAVLVSCLPIARLSVPAPVRDAS